MLSMLNFMCIDAIEVPLTQMYGEKQISDFLLRNSILLKILLMAEILHHLGWC